MSALRPAARAQQQRGALDRADHLLRHVLAERAAAEHHVLHHLDEDAAQAEHRDRAEHRIAVNAQDALHAALQLLRHQHALDARGRCRAPGARQQQVVAVAHRGGIGDVQQHAADLRLVQDVRRQDLHHHREAEQFRGGDGFVGAVARLLGRGQDAGGGQQPLCLGLARRRRGQRHRRHARRRRRRRPAANAAPKRPIAAIAVTARVGSSCTTQPSASSSARRSGGVITDNT